MNQDDHKTFEGETLQQALMNVKKELGTEAEIIETREVTRGGWFGFFGEEIVEVDAYRSGQNSQTSSNRTPNKRTDIDFSSGSQETSSGSQKTSRQRSQTSPTTEASKSSSRNGGNGDDEHYEWSLDETTLPPVDTRQKATQLIEQKSNGFSNGTNGTNDQTYTRSGHNNGGINGDDSPDTGSAGGGSEDLQSDTGSQEKPGIRSHDDSDEDIQQLVETTDLIEEKLEELMGTMQTNQQQNGSAEPKYPGELSNLYADLLGEEIEQGFAQELVSRVQKSVEAHELDNKEVVREQLRREIKEDFQGASPLDQGVDGPMVVPFVGPTGVGKTTTLAKLAAYFSVEENQNVGFLTLDTFRLAAVEQLRRYADILQVPVKDVMDVDEIGPAVEELADNQVDIIFMDTAGRSQFDGDKINNLHGIFPDEYEVKTHLVISACTRSSDLKSVLDGFEEVDFERLVVTKIDETRCHGSIYNLLQHADQSIAYFTDGQDVPDDLWMADDDQLADLLLGEDE